MPRDLYEIRDKYSNQFNPIVPVYPPRDPDPITKAYNALMERRDEVQAYAKSQRGKPRARPQPPVEQGPYQYTEKELQRDEENAAEADAQWGFGKYFQSATPAQRAEQKMQEQFRDRSLKSEQDLHEKLKRLRREQGGVLTPNQQRIFESQRRGTTGLDEIQERRQQDAADIRALRLRQAAQQELKDQGAKIKESKTIDAKTGNVTTDIETKMANGQGMKVSYTGDYQDQQGPSEAEMYRGQYEGLLQQGIDRDREALNLQPIAQLVDTWTGSRMAPGFQDPDMLRRQQLREKIGYAKELASLGGDPEMDKLQKALIKSKIAKNMAPRNKDGKAPQNWFEKFSRVKGEKIIEGSELQKGLRQWAHRLPDVMNDLNIGPNYERYLISIMNTENPRDISAAKAGIKAEMANDYMRRDPNKDDAWVTRNMSRIDSDAENLLADLKRKLSQTKMEEPQGG